MYLHTRAASSAKTSVLEMTGPSAQRAVDRTQSSLLFSLVPRWQKPASASARNRKLSRVKLEVVLVFQVRPEGFEPPTLGSEVRCSVQLSYGRIGDQN